MHSRSLNKLYNFIHVIYNIKEYYTKVEYFSKHNLFITIYLLLDQKLNHNNNSMQEINMRNFIQASEYDVHMHAKFEYLDIYRLL
jgi:hypothetical protein